jgi:hypothetical protein
MQYGIEIMIKKSEKKKLKWEKPLSMMGFFGMNIFSAIKSTFWNFGLV